MFESRASPGVRHSAFLAHFCFHLPVNVTVASFTCSRCFALRCLQRHKRVIHIKSANVIVDLEASIIHSSSPSSHGCIAIISCVGILLKTESMMLTGRLERWGLRYEPPQHRVA
ncbi:hypothetical protein HGRIS_004381 [Hohenbuehelia grisea]|uniref:C2H2-type domain-containing protein n=1 Tax=Hohenbuehelia grisea TaxID=104357 RepID=A0ABR3JC00_9AGAR